MKQAKTYDIAITAAVAVAVIVASAFIFAPDEAGPVTRDPAVDMSYVTYLEKEKPEMVLLGNSILGRGVNQQLLGRLLGTKVVKMGRGGSATAWWYVAIKNVLVKSPHKPKWLVIFFRDTFLTEPAYRVTGNYKKAIDLYAGAYEPILDSLAYGKAASLTTRLLRRVYPPFRDKARLSEGPAKGVKKVVAELALGEPTQTLAASLDAVFHQSNLNQSLLTRAQLASESSAIPDEESFEAQLDRSFLPHIVRIVKQHHINLAFVRAKRRADTERRRAPAALRAYIRLLGAYFKENDIPFFDYSTGRQIKKGHFKDGDHLNGRGRKRFTNLLARDFKKLLAPSP